MAIIDLIDVDQSEREMLGASVNVMETPGMH